MKRIVAILLCLVLVFTLASCGKYGDYGRPAVITFRDNSEKSTQEIADAIAKSIDVELLTTTVTEGLLEGIDIEINGFKNGTMISSIDENVDFIGYVFEMSDTVDQNMFVANLETYANADYNGEGEKNKVIVEQEGDKVVVIIAPGKAPNKKDDDYIDEEEKEDDMVIVGDEFVDDFE